MAIPFISCPTLVVDNISCIIHNDIDVNAALMLSNDLRAGGRLIFLGDVRNFNQSKIVTNLEYEAELSMANETILQITNQAIQKFNLFFALCFHRIGKVSVGESAVIIITTHTHRQEAYNANQYIIDKVKHEAPIWKKEFYNDGTYSWGNNCNCH